MGKCRQIKCRAIRNYTWVYFKWPKMWIKRLYAKIHNIIIIYIHYRTIYFKTITCIVLIIVISNVFACKTHNVFNDFVDFCATGKRNRTGRALCKTGELWYAISFVLWSFRSVVHTKKVWTSWLDNGHNLTCTLSANISNRLSNSNLLTLFLTFVLPILQKNHCRWFLFGMSYDVNFLFTP